MDTNLVSEKIKEFLAHLGIPYSDIRISELGGNTFFTVQTEASGKLIGARGETLSALNYLLKRMLEPTLPKEFHFMVDVNGYHAKHIQSLEDQARLVAERARTFRYDIELNPMTAYERMIIHSTLKAMPDIETSSVGEGPLRHIVVRYKDPTTPTTESATQA